MHLVKLQDSKQIATWYVFVDHPPTVEDHAQDNIGSIIDIGNIIDVEDNVEIEGDVFTRSGDTLYHYFTIGRSKNNPKLFRRFRDDISEGFTYESNLCTEEFTTLSEFRDFLKGD